MKTRIRNFSRKERKVRKIDFRIVATPWLPFPLFQARTVLRIKLVDKPAVVELANETIVDQVLGLDFEAPSLASAVG